jgi:hypothetical protein
VVGPLPAQTAWRGERITQGKSVTYERVVGLVAVLYTIWLMYARPGLLLPSAAVYLASSPLREGAAGGG